MSTTRDSLGHIDPHFAEWMCDNDQEWADLEDVIADEELAITPNLALIDTLFAQMEILEFKRLAEYQASLRSAPGEQLLLF